MKIKRSILIVSLLVIASLAIPAFSIAIIPVAGNATETFAFFIGASCRYYDCKRVPRSSTQGRNRLKLDIDRAKFASHGHHPGKPFPIV